MCNKEDQIEKNCFKNQTEQLSHKDTKKFQIFYFFHMTPEPGIFFIFLPDQAFAYKCLFLLMLF